MNEAFPSQKKRLPWRILDERAVVIHPAMKHVHELNPTASFLWSKMDGKRSIEELALDLTQEFDVDPLLALEDVKLFISKLEENQLIDMNFHDHP